MLIRIVVVQARLGERLTLEEKIHIFKQKPDFVCLPEYYLIDDSVGDFHRAAIHHVEYLEYLEKLSYQLSTCLIGGSVVEPDGAALFNTSYLINRGQTLGKYRKRFPMKGEVKQGIQPGTDRFTTTVEGVRIGLMICADIFHPEVFEGYGIDNVDLLFVPTTSLLRPHDSLSQKKHRDRLYFGNAAESAVTYVVKVCGVGSLMGMPLQGRSLVAAPWGILERIDSMGEQRKRILTLTLDIDELREFREKAKRRRRANRIVRSSNSVH